MHTYFTPVPLYQQYNQVLPDYFTEAQTSTLIPLQEKKDIIAAFPKAYASAAFRQAVEDGHVEYANTSGSSSEKLQLIRRAGWWRQEFERGYKSNPDMAPFSMFKNRKASLTTAVCSGNTCFINNPSFAERIIDQTLYLNTRSDPNLWDEADIRRIDEELHRYAPELLEVDPVYLAIFLRRRAELGLCVALYKPHFITASFEYLTASTRTQIEAAYSCPVFSLYGSTELGVLFIEDATGALRRCAEGSVLELRQVIADRHIFELVVTSWKNDLMPLLRYRTGDLVELHPHDAQRRKYLEHQPLVIKALHGRLSDAVTADDGTLLSVAMIDLAVQRSGLNPLQYQLLFDGARLNFRYVPALGTPAPLVRPDFLDTWFAQRYQIAFQAQIAIRPEASGKFSIVKFNDSSANAAWEMP